jgi:hypothetical protein
MQFFGIKIATSFQNKTMKMAHSHLGYRPDSPKTATLCPGADHALEHWGVPAHMQPTPSLGSDEPAYPMRTSVRLIRSRPLGSP